MNEYDASYWHYMTSETCNTNNISSNNSLSPFLCQVITWTNTDLLLVGLSLIHFVYCLIKMMSSTFNKCICNSDLQHVGHFRQASACWLISLGQNGRHFAGDIFICILLMGNILILVNISLKLIPKGPINHTQLLVQIMAWRRPGDKPLSEPMMAS